MLSPLFEQRAFPDGALLARQGTPAGYTIYLLEGEVELVYRLRQRGEDNDLDGEEVRALLFQDPCIWLGEQHVSS